MRKTLEQIVPQVARGHFEESLWSNNDWVAEEKFDGERFKMHIMENENRFDSRTVSKKTSYFTEKTDNVPHLRDFKVSPDLVGTVLDGEMQVGDSVMSTATVMGSLPGVAVEKQKTGGHWVVFNVFDVIKYKGRSMVNSSYRVRRTLLEAVFHSCFIRCPYIDLTRVVTRNKKAYCEEIWRRGGEGIILKNLNAPYTDKHAWVKVKHQRTYDVVVIGYKDPNEMSVKKGDDQATLTKLAANRWIGAVIFGQYKDGTLVEYGQCSGMNDDIRRELSEHKKKYVGAVITIEAQQRISKSGAFRHPRFLRMRPDKDASQCVYYADEQ